MKYFFGILFCFFCFNGFSQEKDTVIKFKDLDVMRGIETIGFVDLSIDSSSGVNKTTKIIFYELNGDIIAEATPAPTKTNPEGWIVRTSSDDKKHTVNANKKEEKEAVLKVLVAGRYFSVLKENSQN